MNVPEINNITYDKEKGMKKLSREKENELKRQNPEAFWNITMLCANALKHLCLIS